MLKMCVVSIFFVYSQVAHFVNGLVVDDGINVEK